MKILRHAFLSLLLPLALVACAQQDDATPAATPAATAPASVEQPAAQAPQELAPVAGTHYVEIADPQPYLPLNGQIEVVEVFGYTCPACASFQPLMSAWKQRQPDDVRVSHLAAPFGGYWQPYAKAYYAAEALDLADATHQPMFDAIHRQRSLPAQGVTNDALAGFYAGHGADATRFAQAMESFAVSGQMRRALQFTQRTGVEATPTMIVNGKYRVVSGQDFQDVLRIVDYLVEQERAAAGAAAPAGESVEPEVAAE
ncbi:thiol:disulfide interchange protein DsbA/DsbL [Luteimonas dalianensis]|uniref:thiol:disulfide interchange protein DsbA/DsbL n=1 Tax=Luteimonas dalianensis TaxID=1148196 RepID=UPI003BF3755C